jgi:hypothetical protein
MLYLVLFILKGVRAIMFKKLIVGKMGRMALIVLFTCVFCAAGKVLLVEAYDDTTEISVTVGYWGDTQVYTKNITVTPEKLAAAGYQKHSEIYTWIDKGNFAGTTEATGYYLSDIIKYFKIDMNSVAGYNFLTLDAEGYIGSTMQWTPSALFGTRYTFVNSYKRVVDEYLPYSLNNDFQGYLSDSSHYRLSNFYNMANLAGSAINPTYLDDAWNNKQEVAPLLALSKWNQRWSDGLPGTLLDHTGEQEKDGWTLFYGQKSMDEVARIGMAKMIYQIAIWFNGSPSLSVSTDSLKGDVGSTAQVSFHVNTPDEFLSGEMAKNVQWVSDNPDIASIDQNGTVTFNKKGDVDISAIYSKGGKSYSQTIRVTTTQGSGGGTGGGTGTGDGTGDGSGTGSGNGSGNGSGDGSGTGSADGSGTGGLNNYISNADLYLISSDMFDSSGDAGGGGGGGGDGSTADKSSTYIADIENTPPASENSAGTWKIYEMQDDVTKLQYKQESNPVTVTIIYMAIALLCTGGVGEGIRYYLQIKQPKKFKKYNIQLEKKGI